MNAPDTSIDDTAAMDYDDQTEDDWLEEPEELPRRPRRKLLAPIPLALLALLLLAGGFLAGVKVQKGEEGGSASSGSGFAGLARLRGAGASSTVSGGTKGSGGSFPGGFGGAGGFGGGLTAGEVTYVSGKTLYVTNAEGNTVKVKAPAGTTVSKTVSTSVHSIHPGDTIVVRGSQGTKGSVTASSITISSSGSSTGNSRTGGSSKSSGAGAEQQLFGGG